MPVMQHKVEIHYPTRTEFSEDDYQRLEELLGKPPLRLEKRWIRTAPWITVNNRIHTATRFLNGLADEGLTTLNSGSPRTWTKV